MTKQYTVQEAAMVLGVDSSLIARLCRQRRLGFTIPRHGRAWVITAQELADYSLNGRKRAGRRAKQREVQS
jgi:excisionase family DNA binding protein